MKHKYKVKSYKVNIIYNNKYLFKFVFGKNDVKIENWINR